MFHPLRHLGDQLHHNRIVHRNHQRIADLQAQFDTADLQAQFDTADEPVNRAVLALQIGDRFESQADHLEASWLARLTTVLPKPAALRDEAAGWFRRSEDLFVEDGQR